ncbi:MAG: hypothetical protein ACJAZC_001368 [Cryomorphaceae bacterium]|jgi:hypothetical protein
MITLFDKLHLKFRHDTKPSALNYHNKKFHPISNSENGEVSSELIFHYRQEGNVLTCTYHGKNIVKGQLLGLVDDDGNIEMRYHQVNRNGDLMTGTCISVPEIMKNGKIRLHEKWQWTSGDGSKGESILEEI